MFITWEKKIVFNKVLHYFQVRVIVLDKNDVAPTWGSEPSTFEVSEEAPPNTIVTVLKAYDPDTIGTLRYTLVPNPKTDGTEDDNVLQNNVERLFKLDPTTGQLRLAEALDRETKEKYILRVRADDGIQHTDFTLTIVVSFTTQKIHYLGRICTNQKIQESDPWIERICVFRNSIEFVHLEVKQFICLQAEKRFVLSKSESVKFPLIESVICFFTDSSMKKYFSLLNQ